MARAYLVPAKIGMLLLGLLSACSAVARDFKDFRVLHFGDESLPQLSISDICGDRNGFLWIGTQMGLVRFDGHQFTVYTPENTPQLKNVRSRLFFIDRERNVYYHADARDYYRLTQNGPRPIPPQIEVRTQHGSIYPQGGSPFATGQLDLPSGARICIDDYANLSRTVAAGAGKQAPHCRALFTFAWGKELVGIDSGFKGIAVGPDNVVKDNIGIAGDITVNPSLGDARAFQGARMFERNGEVFFSFAHCIYQLRFDGKTIHTSAIITNLDVAEIRSFYHDAYNGYYAIGTISDGLYLLYPKSFSTRLLRRTHNPNAFFGSNIFYAVQHLKQNRYINSWGQEFDLYKDEQRQAIKDIDPHCLFFHEGRLWYCFYDYIKRADSNARTIGRYLYTGGRGWFQEAVTDKWGRTWIATSSSFGRLQHDSVVWLGIYPGELIETIYVADSIHIFMGFRNGLRIYNLATGRETPVALMNGSYVRGIVDDEQGGMWLLTYGNGYYNYRHGKITKMPLDRNGYLSAVHTMLPDRNGFYWMPTNKGLFRAAKAALLAYVSGAATEIRYAYFDKESGFYTNEFNGGCHPCGLIVSDSLFLLPGMHGLVYFNPLHIETAPLSNDIYIDGMLLDDKALPVSADIFLPTDFSSFRCNVASPYFGPVENLALEYRIDGLMKHWQPVIDNRYVQFNRLPHGDYTLRIRKPADLAGGKLIVRAIGIHVATPWYLHAWFLLLCLVLAVASVWIAFRLRVRLLTRQKQKLELQVAERTGQLRDTVKTLELSQADLYRSNQFREQLTSIVLHDIQTPMRFLKRIVQQLLQVHGSLQPGELRNELEELHHATGEVSAYTEDFLVWIKSQKEAFKMERKQILLYSLLDGIGSLYRKIATNTGTEIAIYCPGHALLYTDPALLSIIIRNLVDNAIKYAPNGRVAIRVRETAGVVLIDVADDGIGMSEEQVAQLLADSSRDTVAVGKLGYHFIKDLLRMLGGTLQISSRPGLGTTVTLRFTSR